MGEMEMHGCGGGGPTRVVGMLILNASFRMLTACILIQQTQCPRQQDVGWGWDGWMVKR